MSRKDESISDIRAKLSSGSNMPDSLWAKRILDDLPESMLESIKESFLE